MAGAGVAAAAPAGGCPPPDDGCSSECGGGGMGVGLDLGGLLDELFGGIVGGHGMCCPDD